MILFSSHLAVSTQPLTRHSTFRHSIPRSSYTMRFLTWNFIGELKVTKQTLLIFRQFDQDVKIDTYRRGSPTYEILTDAITTWADDTIRLVSKHTPSDYVLPLSINGTSGGPHGPRGAIRSLAAALTAQGAYNGLIPPSWAHGSYLKRATLDGMIHEC